MSQKLLTVFPRDPVIARDGRPFGAMSGHRMKCVDWPLPSMIAGSVRSAVGKQAATTFDAGLIHDLKSLAIHGGFPCVDSQLYFPAAGDLGFGSNGTPAYRFLPEELSNGEGTDLPFGLIPVTANPAPTSKFGSGPAWWSCNAMVDWLLSRNDVPEGLLTSNGHDSLDQPPKDERTHVKVDPVTYAALDEMLFSTSGLVLDQQNSIDGGLRDLTLSIRVDSSACGNSTLIKEIDNLDLVQPLGGERRLARYQAESTSPQGWNCPSKIKAGLSGAAQSASQPARVRMILATPAIFQHGWRPDWLKSVNNRLEGFPDWFSGKGLLLRLVGVNIQRWQAVSGWSYEIQGPKAVRRCVPSGGVYYFELVNGTPGDLDSMWLESVCDDLADRRDGFGLSMWGVW